MTPNPSITSAYPHDLAQKATSRLKARMAADAEFDAAVRSAWCRLEGEAHDNAVKRKPVPKSFEVTHEVSYAREAFVIAIDEGKTIDEAEAVARKLINQLQAVAEARRSTRK